MSLSLPFAQDANDANREAQGVVSFDNSNGSITAPVVKTDGSVQITTIIQEASAPSTYDYSLSLPAGATLSLDADGVVEVTNSTGNLIGGFAPAWAKDASGADVPTHYQITGTVLRQIVDHSSADITYPVVADPFWGVNLLRGVWKNRPNGYKYLNGNQYSTKLSVWGGVVWTGGGGVGTALVGNQIIREQGWAEFLSRGGYNSTSVHQQFLCHVTYGYDIYHAGLWWDFETARPIHNNWLTDPQRCNWT